jgi:protein-tyrosine phosphatase
VSQTPGGPAAATDPQQPGPQQPGPQQPGSREPDPRQPGSREPDLRKIGVRNCPNLRDTGGYPAAGGRVTRWRTLLRSGSLHHAGPAGADQLAEYGLRTIVDLRTFEEAADAPSPPFAPPTQVRRVSLIGEGVRDLEPRLDAVYRYLIHQRGDAIGQAIGLLAAPGGLPALVHCSAGKDRTGIVIALALASAGVPDEVIAADYALSVSYLGARAAAILGQVRAAAGLHAADNPGDLLDSPAPLLLDVLAWARSAGGGTVDGYLLAHGLTPGDLSTLRDGLTEDAPPR